MCHSERSEESLCHGRRREQKHREILRFAQNDSKPGWRPQESQWSALSSLAGRPGFAVSFSGAAPFTAPVKGAVFKVRSVQRLITQNLIEEKRETQKQEPHP
jgi:hypothetical protein